jgi:hypothetical protein
MAQPEPGSRQSRPNNQEPRRGKANRGGRKRARGEGGLFLRTKAGRNVRVRRLLLEDGTRREVYPGTQTEALQRLNALKKAVADGLKPTNDRQSVGAFPEDWLAKTAATPVRPSTLRGLQDNRPAVPHPETGQDPSSEALAAGRAPLPERAASVEACGRQRDDLIGYRGKCATSAGRGARAGYAMAPYRAEPRTTRRWPSCHTPGGHFSGSRPGSPTRDGRVRST